jgi:hypothetical protein
MESIFDYFISNKEWLFSGFGVAIISLLVSGILNRIKNTSKTVQQSNVTRGNLNIKMGRDINIHIGSNSDRDIINSIKSQQKSNKKKQPDS